MFFPLKNACTFSDVAIVGHYDPTSWDDGYRFRTTRPSLELEMNSDQKAVAPYNTIVSVDIGEDLYNKLKKRDTVRIYYKPEAPLTFLLEEEI